MAKSQSPSGQPRSFVYPTLRMTPGKQAVLDAVAELEETPKGSVRRKQLESVLASALGAYEASLADGVRDWKWHLPTMKAMAVSTLGKLDEAIEFELDALKNALSDQQRAISHSNLSDHYRRKSDYAEAEREARKGHELWPSHGGIICNLALALAKNKRTDEAGRILAALIQNSDLGDPRSIIGAHVQYEDELRELIEVFAEHRTLTDDERKLLEQQYPRLEAAARWRAWSCNGTLSHEDLCHDIWVKEASRLKKCNDLQLKYEPGSSLAAWNPYRHAMKQNSRFRQHPNTEFDWKTIVSEIEIEVSHDLEHVVQEVIRQGTTTEVATMIRKADPDTADYFQEQYQLSGLVNEVARQDTAPAKEKTSLRKTRQIFKGRLRKVVSLVVLALATSLGPTGYSFSDLEPSCERVLTIAAPLAIDSIPMWDTDGEFVPVLFAGRTCSLPTQPLLENKHGRFASVASRTC